MSRTFQECCYEQCTYPFSRDGKTEPAPGLYSDHRYPDCGTGGWLAGEFAGFVFGCRPCCDGYLRVGPGMVRHTTSGATCQCSQNLWLSSSRHPGSAG